eukprot:TRINITY_DN2183_c0_g1_i3.p1 TRINITY_DN2183_c0_g1~~TRINITY_DN2183_c0_g1_i3.p1  ORF type:complete len:191 (+),score=41.69 TRINITY_DN2183_c0_g1_i3:379-951(+)
MGTMSRRTSVLLGYAQHSKEQSDEIIDDLTRQFVGDQYHPLNRNCNHFSEDMSMRLLKGVRPPGWINRAAFLASSVLKVIPENWLWWLIGVALSANVSPPSTQAPAQTQTQTQSETHIVTDTEATPEKVTDIEAGLLNQQIEETEEEKKARKELEEFVQTVKAMPLSQQREVTTKIFMRINGHSIQRGAT